MSRQTTLAATLYVMDAVMYTVLRPYILVFEVYVGCMKAAQEPEETSDGTEPFQRTRALMGRIFAELKNAVSQKGVLERREGSPPTLFHAVVVVHALIVLFIISYPLLSSHWMFPGLRAYDGFFLVFCAAIAMHWMALNGECVLSYIEKRLFYKNYAFGQMPLYQWHVDVLSTRAYVALWTVIILGMMFSVSITVLRNVECDIRTDGIFGGCKIPFGKHWEVGVAGAATRRRQRR